MLNAAGYIFRKTVKCFKQIKKKYKWFATESDDDDDDDTELVSIKFVLNKCVYVVCNLD